VINPNSDSDLYWNQFILDHSSREKEIDNSIFIIKALRKKEKGMDEASILQLWSRILTNKKDRKIFFFRLPGWVVAASVALLLCVSEIIYFQLNQSKNAPIDYQSIVKDEAQNNEIKLIFADQSEKILASKDLEIKYNKNGEIEVNSDKLVSQKLAESTSNVGQLNQLVVPRGKRLNNLILSDGTKLWLNSGSRAIFPVVFTKKNREIFLEGEAYLEVAHDQSKPFFVVTNQIRVKVLGTKFNISAYPDDMATSVVLVEGSVEATIDSKKVTMKPNQLLTYEKSSGQTVFRDTDVLPIISWKDGWMYCEKEKMETIALRLSRYYNTTIEFKDIEAKEITLTGKLDLKTECADIFKAISSTAPIIFEAQNGSIIISNKKIN
jgi:hypothetical protein